MQLMMRGKTWHLRRRVPARYASVEPRHEVWVSLKTDSRQQATKKAPAVWDWSCHAYVPVSELIYAAFRSNAKGLLPPSDEWRRRGL